MDKIEYERLYLTEKSHWWFIAKHLFIETLVPQPIGKLSILDLGAGTGGSSSFLEKWGSVTRIELSTVAAQFLKKRKLSYILSDIMKYEYPKSKFDLVTCLDVLYHRNVPNDIGLLEKIFLTLKPGGLLLITDCAMPFLYSRHDVRNYARQRYTRQELVNKVRNAGFTVRRASYTYFFLFPVFMISRIIIELFPNHTDVTMPYTYINTLLTIICRVEAKLLKIISFPIGSSVIILAQKP